MQHFARVSVGGKSARNTGIPSATQPRWPGLLVFAVLLVAASSLPAATAPQLTWYRFSKDFITQHYAVDSAIGKLESSDPQPAKNKHSTSCGGNDGEIHIGLASDSLQWQHSGDLVNSSMAKSDEEFGVVAEPVNITTATMKAVRDSKGQSTTFTGYFRAWNEGHDRATGKIPPSNPNHIIEVHPSWALQSDAGSFDSPTSIAPMKGYSGYGATKLRPMLESITNDEWLKAYEDDEYVYVQIAKEDNFYQLPVKLRGSVQQVSGAVTISADVYSDAAHKNLIYKQLRIVSNEGSPITKRFQNPAKIQYLLGIFSVNLKVAMDSAKGHRSENDAVFAPEALEFFAYGVPLETAVKSSSGKGGVKCVEETGD